MNNAQTHRNRIALFRDINFYTNTKLNEEICSMYGYPHYYEEYGWSNISISEFTKYKLTMDDEDFEELIWGSLFVSSMIPIRDRMNEPIIKIFEKYGGYIEDICGIGVFKLDYSDLSGESLVDITKTALVIS